MSVDFAALAKAVVSGVPDVRTCLIVSRDGLALGSCPASEEEKALAVWSRVASLGDVERGFVALRDEVWAFCRRGPYTALATSSPSSRPGLIMDRLEQMLLAAEESRVRKDDFRSADRDSALPEAPRGPRTSLHGAPREEAASPSRREGAQVSAWVERLRAESAAQASASPAVEGTVEAVAAPAVVPEQEEEPVEDRGDQPKGEGTEVDTASLSREFAGLLHPEDDEGK
jgi:predicted metal-binding transcription factor (methanogenesis marker protein 9)